MNQNIDVSKLMAMLSKMDKKDLEEGLNKVNKMLNSKDANQIINDIRKNNS